jgi:RNA recognition motif-containing protein
MSGNRIYVGNLSYSISTPDLRNAFSGSGTVTDAKVMTDRETGQSRGFGFVTFATAEDAIHAIASMNGADLAGRALVVNEAKERTSAPAGQGSFNSGGGYSSDARPAGGGGGGRKPQGGGRQDRGGKGGRRERGRDERY